MVRSVRVTSYIVFIGWSRMHRCENVDVAESGCIGVFCKDGVKSGSWSRMGIMQILSR